MHESVMLCPREKVDLTTLSYPYLLQPKYDGFRCLCHQGHLLGRKLKPQANIRLYTHLEDLVNLCQDHKCYLDGELYSPEMEFNDISSILRSYDAPLPEHLEFYIFDMIGERDWDNPHVDQQNRLGMLELYGWENLPHVKRVPTVVVTSPDEVTQHYERMLDEGFEGVILRNPLAVYKHNRGTLREGIIHKVKPFEDIDVIVVGFEEGVTLRSTAEVRTSPTGHMERSSRQGDYRPSGTCGAIVCQDESGLTFRCGFGRGWTHERRQRLWDNQDTFLGLWGIVRHLPIGRKLKPRSPKFLSFRDSK